MQMGKLMMVIRWKKTNFNVAISKVNTVAKGVGSSQMPIERGGVELCENVHFVDPTVNAVAHWNIN